MRLLLPGLGALALATPASSFAGEVSPAPSVTSVAPAGETSVPAPTGEAQAAPATQAPAPPATSSHRRACAHAAKRSGRARAARHARRFGHRQARGRVRPNPRRARPGRPERRCRAARAGHLALSPSLLTPSLTPGLEALIAGVPSFFIESFAVPPFLLPIFQAAGTAYGIPWQVLAAINKVETDYGRDLSVSSAGAEGWMQFLPSTWVQYGVDANGDGYRDPYNPGRRDLRRRQLPARGRRRQRHQGGRVRLQPLAVLSPSRRANLDCSQMNSRHTGSG